MAAVPLIYTSLFIDANLKAYWRFEGNSNDETTNNNDGTDTDIYYLETCGKFSKGLTSNGSTSSIVVSASTSINNALDGGGTICAWIYPKSGGEGTFGRIIDKSTNSTSGFIYYVAYESDSKVGIKFARYKESSLNGAWYTSSTVPINQWTHVSVTHDTAQTTDPIFYINGAAVSSENITEEVGPSTAAGSDVGNNLYIANRSNGDRSFDGYIDDLAIFDRVLSAQEIQDLYDGDLATTSSSTTTTSTSTTTTSTSTTSTSTTTTSTSTSTSTTTLQFSFRPSIDRFIRN